MTIRTLILISSLWCTAYADTTIINSSITNSSTASGSGAHVGSIVINGNVINNNTDNNLVTGSGKQAIETRALPAFNQLEVKFSAEVTISQGKKTSLTITADDNILPILTSTVKNEKLSLVVKKSFSTNNPIQISLTTPHLITASIFGAGSITIKSISSTQLKLSINGSGNIYADGKVENLVAEIRGSGDLNLKFLLSAQSRISIRGSGNAAVNVSDILNASIMGSGDIIYFGSPNKVIKQVRGSGDIVAGLSE